jgi:LuxR family transcriptional regulator, maltose regulon positive regulatory protein
MSVSLESRLVAHGANPAQLAVPGGLVRRSALFDRLSAAGPGGVVLVCAPAGSGKSVLIRSWTEATGLRDRVAWVSVERREQDGQRFWLSVIEALTGVLESGRPAAPTPVFSGEALVERLLSQLCLLDERVVLVIDDLHELHSADAFKWFDLFLPRVPPQLLVVLATREDPRLGLHRLRLTGALTELRGPDLAFSPEEARELLQIAGVRISDAAESLLYERTEGWAAGLRLAAISLAHHPDPERFVTEFSGSERTVAGYLVAEVLEHRPAEVRELLLRTSVLERVSGPLADYLTGGSGSERILQELEDGNAFVTSLDAGRSWFRYHHLFSDLLQLELRRSSPRLVASLHRASAQWLAEHGDVVEAIRHAQAARDWPYAARLLFESRIDLILDGRLPILLALLNAFPAHMAAADPEVAVTFAGARLREGRFEEADAYLALAEQHAAEVTEERRPLFELQLASVRVASARHRGDLSAARASMRSLEAALNEQTNAEVMRTNEIRALALMSLGITELWALELEDARGHLEEGLALARRIGRPYLEIGCLSHLGIAAPLSGLSSSVALRFGEQAVELAEEHGLDRDPIITLAFAVGVSSLACLGRLDEAEQWLERAERTLHGEADPGTELALHHALGLLRLGQRRLEEALEAFRAAAKIQTRRAGEHAAMVDVRMRILTTLVDMGDTAAVRAALEALPESERDRSGGRIAGAAVELAEGNAERAIELLGPVIEGSVKALIPTRMAIHALLFDAAARERLGDLPGAEASLEQALELAEPEAFIHPFLIIPVKGLLERHPRHRTSHATLVTRILDVLAGSSPLDRGDPACLLDELSSAELRVVRYLPSNLKAPEIAGELCVSANTVRTHIRHIYAKLDAHDRNDAVSRARELGLLARYR